jgi:hypothetical protein
MVVDGKINLKNIVNKEKIPMTGFVFKDGIYIPKILLYFYFK